MQLSCICMKVNIKKHSCEDELREVELKVTPARIGILAALEETDEPVDVSSLLQYLKSHHIKADKATVFRIINFLTEKGISKQISFNEGKFRYELANKPEHHHLVCTNCGSVESFSDCAIPALEKDIKRKKKFLVKSHALEFFGVCKDCQI